MAEVNRQNMNKMENKILSEAYDRFSDAIFRYCYFHTGNRQKALDLTQDTFVKTLEYLSSHEKEKVENIRAFLYKVARNLIIDERRKKKSDSLDEMSEKGFDPTNEESELETHEDEFDAQRALEAVNNLDEKYRDIILWRYVEDMTVKEIAGILKESENNVSVRIHRALHKLKEILGDK